MDPAAVDRQEQELAQRARNGEAAAFDILLERHLPALKVYLRKHMSAALRERESCSDIAQSVCREVLKARGEFEYRGPGAMREWLYAWARHKLRDRLRYWNAGRRTAAREADPSVIETMACISAIKWGMASPVDRVIQDEMIVRLRSAFERLPADYRKVIELCDMLGEPRADVGRHMGGRSPGAIRSLLQRARAQFGEEVARLGLVDGDARAGTGDTV